MRETTVDQLAAALDQGAAVVDVREPAEFREGHVPGATNIPMGQLTARLGEIDRDRPVHVVCASGNRSSAMVDVLTAKGKPVTQNKLVFPIPNIVRDQNAKITQNAGY